MPDVGALAAEGWTQVQSLFLYLGALIRSTGVPAQIEQVDIHGLFTNPWFIVPFGLLVAYQVFKLLVRSLIMEALIIAVWWFSGTEYMQTLVIGDQLQLGKVLPVLFGGCVVLGVLAYLVFGRSN